jgi:two-component system sensor histidine kinase HydH
MTIGSSLVLMAVVAFLGVVNYNRDKEQMGTLLKEKGATLIRVFEAGTRTGMMGMMGMMGSFSAEAHLQSLIEEIAVQPDISYISIVDISGVILAHNDKSQLGKSFIDSTNLESLSPTHLPKWRVEGPKDGTKYFEVYKAFLPTPNNSNHMGRHSNGEHNMRAAKILEPTTHSYIFVGLNIEPFETAMSEDLKHNIVMAAIIFFLGVAGVISLFWAQNYTRSHRLLQDTRKFASEVMIHLPVGIIVMDMDHRIIYTNGIACDLLGAAEREIEGTNARQLLPDNVWNLHNLITPDRQVAEKEITISSQMGRPVPVALSATNIHGEDGKYIGLMFVFKDLTEIRALQIKNQHIEKLASVGNLAAGIAHEVRNPLSSIKGYATFLGSLFDMGSEHRKIADLMAEEVDRVNRVISELLEFARPSDLKFEKIKIENLIDHSIRIVTHEAESSGIKIVKNTESGLPDLHADLDRLTQVLLNLYINAIQAMRKGGQLLVQARQKGTALIIDVSDTGVGVQLDDFKRIFDPYFTTKKNGTGLGLAIAHKIVENHMGTIRVKSVENSGTTVSISLPMNKEKEESV